MKDNKKRLNTGSIQDWLETLADEIEAQIKVHGFDDIVHALIEACGDDQLKREGIKLVHHAFDAVRPSTELKYLSITGCLYRVKDEDLLEYHNCIDDAKRFLLANETGTHEWMQALRSVIDLEEPFISELFDRTQAYRHQIESGE